MAFHSVSLSKNKTALYAPPANVSMFETLLGLVFSRAGRGYNSSY